MKSTLNHNYVETEVNSRFFGVSDDMASLYDLVVKLTLNPS